jgi:hypothetical protein
VAQWLGQFSGNTHATRVEDAEDALRHAVTVFRSAASDEERARKGKSLRRIAERVRSSRLKLFRARLDAFEPLVEGKQPQPCGIESLKERETRTIAEGLNGVLREFGAQDAIL